ncbi:MAG: SecD/SecF fusion protein [Psychromonas sp.]|jgi:SecD/SecF fusion protein
MRNKGFFWFLTILLTAICVYQLSFTWVSNSVEKKAEREASGLVADLMKEAKSNDNKAFLPNGEPVDFNSPEGEELAKADFINQILRSKADKKVYPVFGSTFAEVKTRSLAFGLDLVGGMSVTLQISIPEMVATFARNKKELTFKRPYDIAKRVYESNGGDFVSIFATEYAKANEGERLVKAFAISDIEELGKNSTDDDVKSFLSDKLAGALSGVELIMSRRINQFGVAQPNIQQDAANNRLYIELPGVQDEATVTQKLQSTANLQFFETYQGNEIAAQWQQATILSTQFESDEPVEKDTTEVSDLDALTAGGPKGTNKGLADLVQNGGGFSVGTTATENKPAVDKILRRDDIMSIFPEDLRFMWSADPEKLNSGAGSVYVLYAVKVLENGKAFVGGTDIKSASTGFDQSSALVTVDLEMNPEGSDKWAQMTADNKDRLVAITMDNVVYSAPRVNEPINGGRTQISGNFSIDEAKDLSGLLNGGALPAPCVILEQTKVGPTIGAENTKAGLVSFGFALLLVFIYMFFYYGKAGLIADIALAANILFIFGSLASFGAVLTLAGIAGIVLTIGMAVDANVLIFERIREEQAAGKDLKSAIDTGFQKALSSIIDANVTTLLTAIVLKVFGTGPIESFATTLIIGIFTSVFAALVISRLIIIKMLEKNKTIAFDTKWTKGAFKNLKLNFVGNRKKFYIVSAILVIGGLVSLSTKGLKPSVEFSGGRTFGVKFEKSAESQIEYLRNNLSKSLAENNTAASIDLKTKSSSYFVEITTNYKLNDQSATEEVKEKLEEGLRASEDKLGKYEIKESRTVSPTISSELKSSSMISIFLSLIIIFAYILFRFGKWQYSIGAILAMVHDVIIVLACFSILNGILPFNMDIDQAFIAAILTVIGYSINDTVIVFDRIRENFKDNPNKNSDGDQINSSLNSTLSRTINTSMTTFVVLLIIFLFGGAAIKGFILALMIGVIVGTYSSVCIATPLLIDLTKKIKA